MECPFVSIIVPTFNRAKVVIELVHSILGQTYTNFELIVVNDGSHDDTTTLLEAIQETDSRLIVINKENEGVVKTRNRGIERASSKYIFFIDDDDLVPADYIERFMNPEFDEDDLIIDSYSNQIDNNLPIPKDFQETLIHDISNILNYIFEDMKSKPYCLFPIAKRFKSEIIKRHDIRFNPEFVIGEDRPFVIDYLIHSESCRFINTHNYIVREDSSAQYRLSKGQQSPLVLWETFKKGYEYHKNLYSAFPLESILSYLDNFIVSKSFEYILFRYANNYYSDKKDEVKAFSKELRKYKINPNNILNKKIRMLYLIFKHFGLSPTVTAIKLGQLISRK